MRDRIAAALEARANDFGKDLGLPFDQVALMTCVMGNGFTLEKLLEGDAVPDEFYGTMLMVFFAGLEALRDGSPTSAGALA